MERALDLALLRGALGDREGLPTAEELQSMLAAAEREIILRRPQVQDEVLDTAWFLHAVASASEARERYTLARQRQAFQVSAHVFDLALAESGRWEASELLSMAFASQIGYRRGGLDPNATAVFNRARAHIHVEGPVQQHLSTLALEVGVAFLGMEARTLFRWLTNWRRQLADLADLAELPDLETTAFANSFGLVRGVEDLLTFLARGPAERLERSQVRLRAIAAGELSEADTDARWVAAHLLRLSGEAAGGSLWNPALVPPSVPTAVRQAFTMSSPPVLTLWEPQRELLGARPSPFSPTVKRMVLGVPTSGGKTLVAQLLTAAHLATFDSSVCYVAPTRTLCREVRRSLDSRMRGLGKRVGADRPDFDPHALSKGGVDDLLLDVGPDELPDVEVMTPERLFHLLRRDAEEVIRRYGVFIFDEAQLLKEGRRGFTLESVISYLHFRTAGMDHRIILISAAMGNYGQIASWIDPSGHGQVHQSDWRGPRRLHALIDSHQQLEDATPERIRQGRVYPYRVRVPVRGRIQLRLEGGTQRHYLSTTEPIGEKSYRSAVETTSTRGLKLDQARSTRDYIIGGQMINFVGHAGSVLIVAPTRRIAQQVAKGIASARQADPTLSPLTSFVSDQLGPDHPLTHLVSTGVAFHHAGLPTEVLEALEDAVRNDILRYLTCTSTLTEGVNLPVRTVVIYDQTWPDMDEGARLRGPRLVNAIGRAGRAGKESEGWIFLANFQSTASIDDLRPTAEQLNISSSLLAQDILDLAADVEARGIL